MLVGDGSQVMLTRSVRRVNRPWKNFGACYQNFATFTYEYQINFGGRIVPSKRAASAVPLQLGPAPPRDEILFRYRDEEAEEVERYALSKEGLEESQREIDEAREPDEKAMTAEAGVPAPSAPQGEEPSGGLRTPPALQDQSGERGAGGEIPIVIEPLWEIDLLAKKVEEQRLMRMNVMEKLTPEDAHLDKLTTRFVHDWRVKPYVQADDGKTRKRWLRRARLVAREYANDRCDEVYSPASGQRSLRLLPALFLNNIVASQGIYGDQGAPVLGALDIKDAFLQVPQERPLQITTNTGYYKILKNIPGQRIGAKAGMSSSEPTSRMSSTSPSMWGIRV